MSFVAAYKDMRDFDNWGKATQSGACPTNDELLLGAHIRQARALESIALSLSKMARTPREIAKAERDAADREERQRVYRAAFINAQLTLAGYGYDDRGGHVRRALIRWFMYRDDDERFNLLASNAADTLNMTAGTKYRTRFEEWQKKNARSG